MPGSAQCVAGMMRFEKLCMCGVNLRAMVLCGPSPSWAQCCVVTVCKDAGHAMPAACPVQMSAPIRIPVCSLHAICSQSSV